MSISILISLAAHTIVAANMVHRTDDSNTNLDFAQLAPGLLASLVQAKPQFPLKSEQAISKALDNAKEKPVAPPFVAPISEETTEESPYAPPDSIEQMASVINPPDLPLPSDSFSPEGFMRIKVFVNEDGLADYVELLESNFTEDYASTLVGLFKLAKFSPGISGGKAIKSWRIVEIDYSPS